MPRQARIQSEYQHIMVRGIGKQILFEDDGDNLYHLSLLKRFAEDTGLDLLAYCLMENHVHLLVHDSSDRTAVFMKKLGVTYAMYFNRKYERCGHLFQDRYKSETIEDDRHLLAVYRYILNNPIKAGICQAKDYRWSSYRDFDSDNGITNTGLLRELIGDKQSFELLMSTEDDREYLDIDTGKHDDIWAAGIIRAEVGSDSGTKLQSMARAERDEVLARLRSKGLSVRQLERLTGINRGVIQNAKIEKKVTIRTAQNVIPNVKHSFAIKEVILMYELIGLVFSAAGTFFAGWELYSNRKESKRQHDIDRKMRTFEAFNVIQEQVLDEFSAKTKVEFSTIANNCRKADGKQEYVRCKTLIARLEHFALAVNSEIYDIDTVKRLAGGYFICLYDKILPVIETARKNARGASCYTEIETMVDSLCKLGAKPGADYESSR